MPYCQATLLWLSFLCLLAPRPSAAPSHEQSPDGILLACVPPCPSPSPPPTHTGSPDYEGDPPPEPAAGWRDLLTACWSEDPGQRPTFPSIVERLQGMQLANRMARRSRSTTN